MQAMFIVKVTLGFSVRKLVFANYLLQNPAQQTTVKSRERYTKIQTVCFSPNLFCCNAGAIGNWRKIKRVIDVYILDSLSRSCLLYTSDAADE